MKTAERVWKDEKAWWLSEKGVVSPIQGMRRVQRIIVRRDGEMAAYDEDRGIWDQKHDFVFQIPSLWVYSVAELQEMADRAREGKVPQEPEEPIDLLQTWLEELDERWIAAQHRSVSGPLFRKER